MAFIVLRSRDVKELVLVNVDNIASVLIETGKGDVGKGSVLLVDGSKIDLDVGFEDLVQTLIHMDIPVARKD